VSEHWTAEEYRKFRETGVEPKKASPTCCQRARNGGASLEAHFNQIRAEYEARDRETEAQKKKIARAVQDAGKKRKYMNVPTQIDGIRFDSKHEAEVYQELMLLVKSGELKCVLRQVRFDLGGGRNAQEDSRYKYVADFVTVDNDYRIRVLDAKSEATRKNRTYINKKKQMLAEWGIEIEEV
jgi:hypothetical protein